MKILMMPHKDYHAETMYQIGSELEVLGIESIFLRPVEKYSNMGVKEIVQKYGFDLLNNEELLTGTIDPDAVLVMNDWDMASRYLLDYCHENNIPVIGLQEGICDFTRVNWIDKYYNDPSRLPYSYCDCLMLCSEFDATYFPNTPHSIIGMERVESLYRCEVHFPEEPIVLINLNFSFNVCTEFSRQWLLDVTQACIECGFQYIVSRHPQDETDVSGFEDQISETPLHELICATTLFVSRFSNAIYESLILGKPVVYYNFHNERSRNFNETMGAFSAVYNKQDLKTALKYEAGQRNIRIRAKDYLDCHVAYDHDISSAKRSATGIHEFMTNRKVQETAYLKSKISDFFVSIIVPIYNTEEYLPQCLGSLISQTMESIEIICIDDCSPDNSYKIVEQYQQFDNRIRFFRLDKNGGLGAARNYGLKHAQGNAILFVDSDDWVMPEFCEEVYTSMLKTQSDVVVFNYINSYPNRQAIACGIDLDGINKPDFRREELLKNCGACFKMYAHDFIKNNAIKHPEGVLYEDWFWSMQWLTKANKITAINKPYYFYRQSREGSIVTSGDRFNILKDIIKNIELSFHFLSNNNYDIKYLYTFINKMDAQTSRLAIGEEKEKLEKVIFDYLKKMFPFDLPKEINSPHIKNIYKRHDSKKDTTLKEKYIAPDRKYGKERIKKIWEKYFKPIMIKVSPTYRALWRIEPLVADLHKRLHSFENRLIQINTNNQSLNSKLEQYNKLLKQYNDQIDQHDKTLSSYNRLTEQHANRLDGYNTQLKQYANKHDDNNFNLINRHFDQFSQKYNTDFNVLSKKIDSFYKACSSSMDTLFELQDIIYFGGNDIGEPSNTFLKNLEIPSNNEKFTTIKLFDHEIRFSDALSFWCVYKELFIDEDYGINYKTNTPRILDCGAHIGLASIYVKNAYPHAKITAFEPDPQNVELLRYNLASFGFSDIEIVPKAVGDKNDTVNFYKTKDMSMGGSITQRMKNERRELEQFSVPMCRLRDYIVNDKIDFLKLDVEGVEDQIILDCEDCINHVNYLFIEFHCGDDLTMSRIVKTLQVLDNAGFTYHITRSNSYRKIYRNKPLAKVMDNCTHLIYAKNKIWM